MKIIRLPESTINQIAAGEVVERPASAAKELIENALDAGATRIEVISEDGGKSLLRIIDNGHGMTPQELSLAIERHCTSKLSDDLMDIRTLGFRGEALPSIGSVSRLKIASRQIDSENAWQIEVDHGTIRGPSPAALSRGTMIEVRDLFANVPARLKFLKTDRAEAAAITDIVKRMALAFPHVNFIHSGEGRAPVEYPGGDLATRIGQVVGTGFVENALTIDENREGVRLHGLVGVPTFNRGNGLHQYFFVNGRPVRDKQLLGAVRGAYSDFLARGRFPIVVLFIEMPPHEVDVNVHPAKAEVRFRDSGLIRSLLVGSIKRAIEGSGPMVSSEGGARMSSAFVPGSASTQYRSSVRRPTIPSGLNSQFSNGLAGTGFGETAQSALDDGAQAGFEATPSGHVDAAQGDEELVEALSEFPLGAARAQIHKNYIISQTDKGLVIVDQHAAHERIVYEKLKKGLEGDIPTQLLLIPEIIDLPGEDVDRLETISGELARLGLVMEKFGPGAVIVRETPAMLGQVDVKALIVNLADEMAEWGSSDGLSDKLEYLAATIACHHSVRSGRLLKADEMNALLRQMESTPNSGQCNHGRPTWIELDLKDIERLFGR